MDEMNCFVFKYSRFSPLKEHRHEFLDTKVSILVVIKEGINNVHNVWIYVAIRHPFSNFGEVFAKINIKRNVIIWDNLQLYRVLFFSGWWPGIF